MSDPRDGAWRAGGEQRIPRPAAVRVVPEVGWAAHDPVSARHLSCVVAASALDQLPLMPTFPDARPSAVLITLLDGDDGAEVLLTKRSKELRNHSGEISFPGGRIDTGESPVAAALREAHEEVGLPPALVQVQGQLSHLSTVVSRSYIVPIVATVDERPVLTPHDREVARILWIPLRELAQPTTYREEWWGSPPLDRRMHFFELDDETVWGATAFMLYELLSLAYGPPATRTAP